MILTNRRIRLLFLCLAGMDVAVLLPWLRVLFGLWARDGHAAGGVILAALDTAPLGVFVGAWSLLILYMLGADLLDRAGVGDKGRAAVLFGMVAVSGLATVRVLLYPTAPWDDLSWLSAVGGALVNLGAGLRGEVLLILANYVLWWRVAGYADRSLTFFAVGLSFRLGMLLATLGAALAVEWLGQPAVAGITALFLFFGFGLAATALARIDQKAMGAANSSGALLPWDRFAQLGVTITAILGGAGAAAAIFTPQHLRTVLGWFGPVGVVLSWLLAQVAFFLFLLLTPLLEALAARIQAMMADSPIQVPEQIPPPTPPPLTEVASQVAALRYCMSALIIVAALALLYILFVRTARRLRQTDAEEAAFDDEGLQPGKLDLGLDRLGAWLRRLGRLGVGQSLLAAITVENIYANVTRLARRRGYPRPAAEDPTRYLARLHQAFPTCTVELDAITTAYLTVHYAERPLTADELAQVRAAYTAVVAAAAAEQPARR